MGDQPELSREEWTILFELLEQERAELHPEIRHTRTSTLRDELHRRLEVVEALLERLRPLAEPSAEAFG
jgi:hypothetical protein